MRLSDHIAQFVYEHPIADTLNNAVQQLTPDAELIEDAKSNLTSELLAFPPSEDIRFKVVRT